MAKKMYINKELRILFLNNTFAKESINNFETFEKTSDVIEENCQYNGLDLNITYNHYFKKHQKQKKYNVLKYSKHYLLDRTNPLNDSKNIFRTCSLPDPHNNKKMERIVQEPGINSKIKSPFNTDFILACSRCHLETNALSKSLSTLNKLSKQRKQEQCSFCNSNATFDIIKGFDDYYKHCDSCVYCGHLQQVQIRAGKSRKSALALETVSEKEKVAKSINNACMATEGKHITSLLVYYFDLAMYGVPLSESRTASEKEMIDKVETILILLPEADAAAQQEQIKKMEAAGVLVPLKGKTRKAIDDFLKKQANLLEARSNSERALIKKLSKRKKSFERLSKAKAAGLLSPLKSKEEVVKMLKRKGMINPIPEQKMAPEKKLIDKLKVDSGVPPEPKTSPTEKKHKKALASGIITGWSPEDGNLARKRISMPQGHTKSIKALLQKLKGKKTDLIKVVTEGKDKVRRMSSKILKDTKVAGNLTSLKYKTQTKEKEIGVAENNRRNIAVGASIIQPFEGKSKLENERIMKSQRDTSTFLRKEKFIKAPDLPILKGTTSSEKEIINKKRKEGSHSDKHTQNSEKIKKHYKKLGDVVEKGISKGVTAKLTPQGVVDSIENIVITTKYDRGPTVKDKKKIKHSYLDMKGTSPHMSSLCLHPGKCVPKVRGAFKDKGGIKFIIGRISGAPLFHSEVPRSSIRNDGYNVFYTTSKSKMLKADNFFEKTKKVKKFNAKTTTRNPVLQNVADDCLRVSAFNGNISSSSPNNYNCSKVRLLETVKPMHIEKTHKCPLYSKHLQRSNISFRSSYDSVSIVETYVSLSFSSKSECTNVTTSIISLAGSSLPSNASYMSLDYDTCSLNSMCEFENTTYDYL